MNGFFRFFLLNPLRPQAGGDALTLGFQKLILRRSQFVTIAYKAILRGAVLAVALMSLMGCSSQSLAKQAMEFNETVQEHRVEQLFLNVIRAANHQPMALTAVSELQTTNTVGVNSGAVGFAFGPLSSGPYAAAPSAAMQTNPKLGVAILDNDKEFVAKFQEPITVGRIQYFLAEGWNSEMLAFLFIESAELNYSSGHEFWSVMEANPDLLAEIESRDGRSRLPSRNSQPWKEWVDNDPADSLYPLLEFYIHRLKNEFKLEAAPARSARSARFSGSMSEVKDYVAAFPGEYDVKHDPITKTLTLSDKDKDPLAISISGANATLKIRSTQGVLYYLGELARYQLTRQPKGQELRIPQISSKGTTGGNPLFAVQRGVGGEVTTSFKGQFYTIPKTPPNRSMSALSLVQQLIMLQQGKVEPTSNTLQVIGGTLR